MSDWHLTNLLAFLAAVRAPARAAANGDGWDEVVPQAAGPFA